MKDDAANHISSVEILPVKPLGGLLGFVSFLINDSFYVGNVALHSRPSGDLRLVYPEKVLPNGKTIHCFHPVTKDAGNLISSEVFKKYQQVSRLSSSLSNLKEEHKSWQKRCV